MQHNSIPAMVDSLAKASKMLDSKLSDVTNAVASVLAEADHYGISKKKVETLTIRELMNEINLRRAQANNE